MNARDEVLACWRAWDDKQNDANVRALVRAEQSLGLAFRIPHQHVHSLLTAWRRCGYPYAVCVDAFIAGARQVQARADA